MDQSESQAPVMCAAGCGFYGNPACENLCSKCYRDRKSEKPAASTDVSSTASAVRPSAAPSAALLTKPVDSPSVSQAPPKTASPAPVCPRVEKVPASPSPPACEAEAGLETPAAASSAVATPSPKKPKNRCAVCRKKVGLLGFKCRCEGLFCSLHRHAQDHNCKFDYMAFDRDQLAKANPTVAPDKLERV